MDQFYDVFKLKSELTNFKCIGLNVKNVVICIILWQDEYIKNLVLIQLGINGNVQDKILQGYKCQTIDWLVIQTRPNMGYDMN